MDSITQLPPIYFTPLRRWRFAVSTGDLLSPKGIQALFEVAARLGFVPNDDDGRLKVFATAVMDCRVMVGGRDAAGRAPHAGAILKENVPLNKWTHREGDVVIARRLMAAADREA